jgi:hypothetical protein
MAPVREGGLSELARLFYYEQREVCWIFHLNAKWTNRSLALWNRAHVHFHVTSPERSSILSK